MTDVSSSYHSAEPPESFLLCRLHNKGYCTFYHQRRTLTFGVWNAVVSYSSTLLSVRTLSSSLEKERTIAWEETRIKLFHSNYYIFVTSQGRSKWNSCYRLAVMGHKTGYRLSLWFIVLPRKFPPLQSFVFYFSFLQEVCRNWLK